MGGLARLGGGEPYRERGAFRRPHAAGRGPGPGGVRLLGDAAAAEEILASGAYDFAKTLNRGVACVEEIRAAVGDKIAIEGNARWNLPAAARIARALEPYDIMWLEEMIPPDNVESYARLKAESRIPLCVSERLFTRFGFRRVVEANAADIIIPDCSWTGGISETRKICALADSYYLPVTCHDATGPVALWAAAHLMLHIPNAMILETVRAYYDGWYNDLVTERIPINAGMLSLPERPGLGVALREEVLSWPDARIDRSHGKVE